MSQTEEDASRRIAAAIAAINQNWELGGLPVTRADLAKGLAAVGAPVTTLAQTIESVMRGQNQQAGEQLITVRDQLIEYMEFARALVTAKTGEAE